MSGTRTLLCFEWIILLARHAAICRDKFKERVLMSKRAASEDSLFTNVYLRYPKLKPPVKGEVRKKPNVKKFDLVDTNFLFNL